MNLLAAWMHLPYLRRTRSGETDLPATWKMALALAMLSAAAGAAMAVLLGRGSTGRRMRFNGRLAGFIELVFCEGAA